MTFLTYLFYVNTVLLQEVSTIHCVHEKEL